LATPNKPTSNNPPKFKSKEKVAIIVAIITAAAIILAALITGIFTYVSSKQQPTAEISPTATLPAATISSPTTLPEPTPTTPNVLYQTDFSKDNQEWLNGTQPQQWTYNDSDQALESDGNLPCCNPPPPSSSIANAALAGPYTTDNNVRNFAVEAKIKITGLNHNLPSNSSQPSFFGIYVRGDQVNGQGYMAGIGWIYSTPNGTTSTNGPRSYLIRLGPNAYFYNNYNQGVQRYPLDIGWHIYRLEVRGNSFMLKVDNQPVFSHPIIDSAFSSGRIGLENYNCLLQVQSYTVYSI
jgi:hypothetical protein